MKYEELKRKFDDDSELLRSGDAHGDYEKYTGRMEYLTYKGFIALQVDVISNEILPPKDTLLDDLELINILQEDGSLLGTLIPCANLEVSNPSSLPDVAYIAYLSDIDKGLFPPEQQYRLQNHYMVIHNKYYGNYMENLADTSILWGGYFHDFDGDKMPSTYKKTLKSITAVLGLEIPESEHRSKAIHSLIQNHTFERFLNKYHLLEMLFMYQLVKNIKDESDMREAIKLIEKYGKKMSERDLLKEVIKSRCNDISKIAECLNIIHSKTDYKDAAKRIYIEKNDSNFQEMNNFLNLKPLPSNENSQIHIVSECIYIIRNAIVHTKIGKYFLTQEDEEFVSEVIEPLIQEILQQAFHKKT